MLCLGHNEIDGIPVEVVRKRVRRINLRIAPDGTVRLSVSAFNAPADIDAFARALRAVTERERFLR